MNLPKELEPLRNEKIWVCHPLIWNDKKHGGVGGYDKPPINPHTLGFAQSDNPDHRATFDEAAACIGEPINIKWQGKWTNYGKVIAGVGICLGGTGVIGIDLDNVLEIAQKNGVAGVNVTHEAKEIALALNSYTEISPSKTGLHIFIRGEMSGKYEKLSKAHEALNGEPLAEYQIFTSGYMTVSGLRLFSDTPLAERTEELSQFCDRFFECEEPVQPQKLSNDKPKRKSSPPVVSCTTGFTYERWLSYSSTLSDTELLEKIFQSGKTGARVKSLYDGDMSEYFNDHSRADQALCTFLYGFTNDRGTTERLFRSSKLYRASGKSRTYLDRTLTRAEKECTQLVGHIELTAADKKAYAQQKQKEESEARRRNYQTAKGKALRWNDIIKKDGRS